MKFSSSATAFWLVIVLVSVTTLASPVEHIEGKSLVERLNLMKGKLNVFVIAAGKEDSDPPRMLENCRDIGGRPYAGYFPNPSDCSTFFTCHSVGQGQLAATRLSCPFYRDSTGRQRLLHWNQYKCVCDYPWDTKCYDLDSDYICKFCEIVSYLH